MMAKGDAWGLVAVAGEGNGEKFVYLFEEGNAGMRNLLGGKGSGLAEMTRIGLPVPPGFTITTRACIYYQEHQGAYPPGLQEAIQAALRAVESKTGKRLGDPENPLLVSVRSGAAISMPGMMDTILNLGLNDQTVRGLSRLTQNERFAYDSYRRFIQMFGNVVMGIHLDRFEKVLEKAREKAGVEFDYQLPPQALQELIGEYKEIVREATGREFPQDPADQLGMAINAVFDSWNNPRAKVYRQVNKIPDDLGTAVNVQVMVFGNMGDDSGTGVCFTRNPSTGAKELYGEYLPNAQGEDVVAGIRTPRPISQMARDLPQAYQQLVDVANRLESHFGDVQDIEFTVERGRLYMLQTRSAKRTAQAAVKIAIDLVAEGKITREEAIRRIEPQQLVSLLHRGIDESAKLNVIATGLPASPGAATGEIVFDADRAEALGREGHKVILVRTETTPDDIHGIVQAQGILTSRGGMTCHAAIVARHMGKPCVVGCDALHIDPEGRTFTVGELSMHEGDIISIDGATGRVIAGTVPLVDPVLTDEFRTLLEWADEFRRLGVEANADTPQDAAKARDFGATGIGLCRTEHMFMAPDRIPVVQEMIMAATPEERRAALDRLLPMQEGDFYGILKAMAGYPVTIRLLDPPLHEFLPNTEELALEVERLRRQLKAYEVVSGLDELLGGQLAPGGAAGRAGLEKELAVKEQVLRRARALAEFNPMLGLRGCRLGIVYPEIYEMQARAIFQATARLRREGVDAQPEVMIPLVGHVKELAITRELVVKVANEVQKETGVHFEYKVGTMIEIPRAALTADEIATQAEFFSFGTNDLTQTTFGFSRDDAEAKVLPFYLEQKILPENPFAVIDTGGVGKLVEMATRLGRAARPDLRVGICGEHGGDPESIAFFHKAGLDYVSCSPYRVPVARLAAAQAALRER